VCSSKEKNGKKERFCTTVPQCQVEGEKIQETKRPNDEKNVSCGEEGNNRIRGNCREGKVLNASSRRDVASRVVMGGRASLRGKRV